jgi:hypothetical protein
MYVIKSNLPTEENGCRVERWLSRGMAVNSFLEHYKKLSQNYETEMHLRNEDFSDARGTIQVLVDGFFHYIELFKEKK